MGAITYHNKDVASKTIAETLKGKSLAVFGRPDLKIVDILPTNLPVIESNELRLDNLFLLSDGSVAIIDYESVFDKEDFVKYLNYIVRVIKRYADQKNMEKLTRIKMIVIYTADVEHAEAVYNLEGIILVVEQVFLVHSDTNKIYHKLKTKIEEAGFLTDEELLQLMILPLTVKGTREKQPVIVSAVNLAKHIKLRSQSIQALAWILTFSDKVIDKAYKERIKEEMQMTQIGQMLIDEGIEKGIEKATEKLIRTMLLKNKTVEDIHNDTDIPVEVIIRIKESGIKG